MLTQNGKDNEHSMAFETILSGSNRATRTLVDIWIAGAGAQTVTGRHTKKIQTTELEI